MRSLHLLGVIATLMAVSSFPVSMAAMIELETYRFDPLVGEPAIPQDLAAQYGSDSDGYYLVQVRGPVGDAFRADLVAGGARVYGYLPESAFLVGMDPSARERIAARADVAWVGPFHPAYRISPAIGTHTYLTPQRAGDDRLTLMVRVFRDLDGVAAQVAGLGCELLERSDDGFSQRLLVRATPDLVAAVARLNDVWWIEEQPEFLALNNTTRWVAQSNVSGWVPLWDHGIDGEGMLATIMDSGVDYNSCWFREAGNAPPGPTHRKVVNYSLFGGGVAYDGCDTGHGSHVAGTMCGDQSYINPGNTNYNGMAYKAKFTVQDVGADDWTACNLGAISVPSSLTAAFNASYSLGARVHQNSWGSTSTAYDGYSVDVDNAMWNHPEFLVCFAAGNSGPNAGTVGTPGVAKNCITVGATRQAPQQDVIASYSSRGPATDSRYKPTVTSPGGEDPTFITSVDNHPGNPPSATCQTASSPFQGTSMATPSVSGMALNTQQYFSEGFYPDGEASSGGFFPWAALVKAVIVSSTDDMAAADIPNNNEGWGRMLMDNALYFDGDTRELIVEQVAPGLGTGQTWSRDFEVDSAAEPLVVTVVWTDYPGTSGASVALVNDLDITLTTPGGAQYKGNVFSGGFSTAGGSYDRRNVEECARLSAPPLGTYTLEVRGYNVPHGPQPFAVAINGGFGSWPPGGITAAPEGVTPVRRAWVEAAPNPSRGLTQLAYAVPSAYAGRVTLDVVDASGRVVRQLVGKGQRGGLYSVTWDGLDDQRRAVAEGVYFARLRAGDETAGTRVIVTR